jgi:hypothetical protein
MNTFSKSSKMDLHSTKLSALITSHYNSMPKLAITANAFFVFATIYTPLALTFTIKNNSLTKIMPHSSLIPKNIKELYLSEKIPNTPELLINYLKELNSPELNYSMRGEMKTRVPSTETKSNISLKALMKSHSKISSPNY